MINSPVILNPDDVLDESRYYRFGMPPKIVLNNKDPEAPDTLMGPEDSLAEIGYNPNTHFVDWQGTSEGIKYIETQIDDETIILTEDELSAIYYEMIDILKKRDTDAHAGELIYFAMKEVPSYIVGVAKDLHHKILQSRYEFMLQKVPEAEVDGMVYKKWQIISNYTIHTYPLYRELLTDEEFNKYAYYLAFLAYEMSAAIEDMELLGKINPDRKTGTNDLDDYFSPEY